MKQKQIKLTNISKSFGGVHALKNISLEINQGDICCIVGENGSGKSTLIKIIAGVYAPDEGRIELNKKSYKKITPIEAINQGISVIYQDFSIFPNLTVAENIALNSFIMNKRHLIRWKQIYQEADKAVNRIGLEIDLRKNVEGISVAERQLIAISRALSHNAGLIIMDEPTTALTQKEVNALFHVIGELKKENISVIFVSHKLEEIMRISEKIFIFRNGEKVAEGDIDKFDRKKIIYYMTGRVLEDSRYNYHLENEKENSLLRVEKITQKGGFKDISFDIKKGEIVGITGLLGSGRNALARALFGVNPIQYGNIYIEGKQVKLRNIESAIKHGIAYLPEDRLTQGLFLERSIINNIIVTILDKILNKIKLINNKLREKIADKWIKKLNIKTVSKLSPVNTLSGGNQQKVVIAKWLAKNPKILILNSPTVGVDVGAKVDIIQIIRTLAESGVGIILVSDDSSEMIASCNRVLVMRKGYIISEIIVDNITEENLNYQVRKITNDNLAGDRL